MSIVIIVMSQWCQNILWEVSVIGHEITTCTFKIELWKSKGMQEKEYIMSSRNRQKDCLSGSQLGIIQQALWCPIVTLETDFSILTSPNEKIPQLTGINVGDSGFHQYYVQCLGHDMSPFVTGKSMLKVKMSGKHEVLGSKEKRK